MPYADNKSEKFNEILGHALNEVRTETSYLDDLSDANLSEKTLQDEVRTSEVDVWKNVEVIINKYELLEKMLKERESELALKQGSLEPNVDASLTEIPKQVDLTLESLKTDLEKLKGEVDSSLLQDLKERLRLTINSKVKPNYATTLTMFEAPGLSEVLDPARTVDTSAKSSLLYMLNTMPGGSIGIAGSRGSGKSTLIQMCCGTKRIINDIQGMKVLPVLTSAPVQYESRDFILYLFSVLCQRVLDPDDTEDAPPTVPEIDNFSTPPRETPTLDWLLRKSPGILYKLGAVLIVVSLLATILVSLLTTSSSNPGSNQPLTQSTQPATNARDQVSGQPGPALSPTPSTAVSSAPVGRTRAFIENLIKVIDIKPAVGLTWGIFLWVSAFSLSLLRRAYIENRSFPQSYKEYATASQHARRSWEGRADFLKSRYRQETDFVDYANSASKFKRVISNIFSLPLRMRGWLIRLFFRNQIELLRRLDSYRYRFQDESALNSVNARAKRWLQDIRFQQSFTSGWSGALKLPIGLEGGVNRAVTLAQRQMSNPEIVAAYIKFVDQVAKEYKIIIGIDELDKMESEDDARKFLNEIKSIFGLQNCFYLISVSENAMSNFERRGLPFRDVFDSSFDNVVYVDYLNHRTAKSLLERRIIGKPYPFIYLSYCLSGGLPRDLIRNFRNLLESNQLGVNGKSGGRSLAALCQAVITTDLKAKIRATAASAKKIDSEPASSSFIERLFQINSLTPTDASLLTEVHDLLQWQSARPAEAKPANEAPAGEGKTKQVESLSRELGSYLYLLGTVLAFFNDSLDEGKLRKAAADGDLEALANARQFMEVNPAITVSLLNKLRSKWGNETLVMDVSGKAVHTRPMALTDRR